MTIYQIIVLFFSAVIHEYMHGWAALQLGDDTAKEAGRLTLNPISHIDPVGSILVPAFMAFSGTGMIWGWAKPVPFNPYNLRDQRWGPAIVAAAGPLGNLAVALILGLVLRLVPLAPVTQSLLSYAVIINLLLMVFNLVPLPPLDGSKLLWPFLPSRWLERFAHLERYGMLLVFGFLILGGTAIIWPVIEFLYGLIVGA